MQGVQVMAVAAVLLFAGCTTSSSWTYTYGWSQSKTVNGQPVAESGMVTYNGYCQANVTLSHTMTRTQGDIIVTLKDGGGGTVGRETWNGREPLESHYQGVPGTWTFIVERFQFAGSYRLNVAC